MLGLSCEPQELLTEAGPVRMDILSMQLDSSSLSDPGTVHSTATNAYGEQIQFGLHSSVKNSALIKFSDLSEVLGIDDSLDYSVTAVQLIMLPYERWPHHSDWLMPVLSAVRADSSVLWYSSSDIDSLWPLIEADLEVLSYTLAEYSDSQLVLDIDPVQAGEDIRAWENGEINTGWALGAPSGGDSVMYSFYSRDYSFGARTPYLKVYVDLLDSTDGSFVGADTLQLPATADLTRSISEALVPDSGITAAANRIWQGRFKLPALRDSLSREKVINQAELHLDIQSLQMEAEDTLMLSLLLKRPSGEEWETVSGLSAEDTLDISDTELTFYPSALLQYMIGGGRDEDLSLFLRFNSEYGHYSVLSLDPASLRINLNYVEVE